ncbi:MAG: DUF2865 domain-containing protein [Mesorhizobium sp.]
MLAWRLGLVLIALGAAESAAAQDARCVRLSAQLSGLERGTGADASRLDQYRDAIDRQSVELQRTTDYAMSIGCDLEPRRECNPINANIDRMHRNLAALQGQFDRVSANLGGQREDERGRILATMQELGCNGRGVAAAEPPASGGFFEKLFGPDETEGAYDLPPSAVPGGEPVPEGVPQGATMRTICVRKCDGYFFPINFSTSAANFPTDAESCRSQCPSAEVELYAYDSLSQTADDAVSTVTGESLKAMPNAFKFRTSYTASCTCKAAGQGVAQTQAPAGEALKRLDDKALDSAAKPAAPAPPAPPVATAAPGEKKKVRIVGPAFAPNP